MKQIEYWWLFNFLKNGSYDTFYLCDSGGSGNNYSFGSMLSGFKT